jgi:homoserine kinase type II
MAVFTTISFEEAAELFHTLNLGALQQLEGCLGGIENTNYFARSDQGEYVLTVFERLSFEQLPFYLRLMKHLAAQGIPVPDPAPDRYGEIVHSLQGRPAAVVNRLKGHSELMPHGGHCAQLGQMLARMHLAGRSFDRHQTHLRGQVWWEATIPLVLPFLTPEQTLMIRSELAFQQHTAASSAYRALPVGPIHGDLFRDNAIFSPGPDGHNSVLTGLFDFYFAGVDTWLFDIAVCLNDWCIDLSTGAADPDRSRALLRAYGAVRPITAAERLLLPALLRAGALRFWTSRLWDLYLPREATMLKPHDPEHFERILRQRIDQAHGVSHFLN